MERGKGARRPQLPHRVRHPVGVGQFLRGLLGLGELSGRHFRVSGRSSCYGLTAPGAAAQDTEKAAVFHYSKVKDELPSRLDNWSDIRSNVTLLHSCAILHRHRHG